MENKNKKEEEKKPKKATTPAKKTAPTKKAATPAKKTTTTKSKETEDVKENKTVKESKKIEEPEKAEELKKEEDNWQDRCLRITAEYQNYRTRTQKEKDALGEDVLCDTVSKFLPVLDNLRRAMNAETKEGKKGIELIYKGFLDILTKLKIEEISPKGESFDPNTMDAVMHIENPDLGENIVSDVFETGYKKGDRILRHAVVQVAN